MSRKTERIFYGELDIELEVGCMINLTKWIPASQPHQTHGSELSYQHMTVSVALNDVVLLDQNINNQTAIHHQFVDRNPGTYKLQIELNGDFERFKQVSNSLTVYPMLRIKGIWIEGLSMHNSWKNSWFGEDATESGTEFMSGPGVQTLVFNTPIYQWLLQHERKFNYFIKEKKL